MITLIMLATLGLGSPVSLVAQRHLTAGGSPFPQDLAEKAALPALALRECDAIDLDRVEHEEGQVPSGRSVRAVRIGVIGLSYVYPYDWLDDPVV
jgi:hypothetical protein